MKNKKWIVICLLIVCMLVSVSITSATVMHTKQPNQKSLTTEIDTADDPSELSFYPNFLVIIGRYTSVEINQTGSERSLIIQCDAGRILVFGRHWCKCYGQYAPDWVYISYKCICATSIKAPCFYGFLNNGRVLGVTFGNWDVD